MLGLAHRGFSLHDARQHIIHPLRGAGYRSTLIGVQHVAGEAEQIGYDEIVPVEDRSVRSVAPAASRFLRDGPQEPFFLSVGFTETHREFSPVTIAGDPRRDPDYTAPPPPLPDTPRTRDDMAAFKATASILDEGVGVVLDALEETGLAERTLVLCTTDHGIAFPAMKCNLTDHGIGVMLIMRGPQDSAFSGGQVCDSLISHIDIYPTLCDLVGLKRPDWLQGRSLMPLMTGAAQEVNEQICAEVTYHAAYEPQRAIRTQRWKYIRRFDSRETPVLPNCDDSPSKDVWLDHGWATRPVATEQLYDLVFDPHETHNLAEAPTYAAQRDALRERLDAWMRETDDPLLDPPVPAPSGAHLNDPDGLSPREPVAVVP
jgi:arylsulfatase A-like enzyme